MKISVIIPVYNEEDVIEECLRSLANQTLSPDEIIVIDDGSIDSSKIKVQSLKSRKIILLEQNHKGPGEARNLGAQHTKGEILVFVDADMTFDKDFLKKLTEPIRHNKTKGTFTKEEFVSNWENVWSRCWNYNEGLTDNRRVPVSYPDTAPVFRAILKKEFDKAGGFDAIGYTDDWTLSRKLGYQAMSASGAIVYHKNPDTLLNVFSQARWIGKNEFLTKNVLKRVGNFIRYSLPFSIVFGLYKTLMYKEIRCIIFKIVYDFGVFISILGSFFNESKNR